MTPIRSPWRVVPFLMAALFAGHFNRIAMSVAGSERLIPEEGIDPTRMGAVYSTFLFAYLLLMTPAGALADRIGPWLALVLTLAGLGLGSIATGTLGLVAGGAGIVGALLVIRALMGASSAPLHPAASRTLANWFPAERRGLANGVTLSAAMLGAAFTYYLFGALMDRFDWPGAFLVTGVLTLAVGAGWMLLGGDAPGLRRARSTPSDRAAGAGWRALFQDRNLRLVTLAYAAVDYFEYLFFYWMQFYFGTVLGMGAEASRLYATIVTLAMAAGVVSGGWFADGLGRRFGLRGRVAVPFMGMVGGAVLLLVGVNAESAGWIVVWFALGAFAITTAEAPCWAIAVDLGGPRGSTAGGIMNTAGNLGGFLAPIVSPFVGERFGWPAAIGVGAAVSLLGSLLWLGVRERHREGAPPR